MNLPRKTNSDVRNSAAEITAQVRPVRALLQTLLLFMAATLLFFAFFGVVVFQNRYLAPGDALTYSLSAFSAAPTLWLDYLGCGMPVAFDPQFQMWYPIEVLCRALFDYNTLVVSAYICAFCSSFAFAYALSRSKLASLVAALVYSMSGFMFAHLGHVTIIHAAAWLPLFLLSIEMTSRSFKWYWLVVGEAAVALCLLGGHTQILVMQLLLGALYTLCKTFDSSRLSLRLPLFYAAVCLSGLALAALQVVPTLELAKYSARADWSFENFVSFSLPPRQLAQFFFPFIFNQPASVADYGRSAYMGEWSVTELAGYTGLIPLMLALVALVRAHGRTKWFWLFVAVLSLVVACGDATPLSKLLYKVPVLNHFRCPARYVLVFDLAISVLAALGVAALQRSVSSSYRRLCVVISSSIVFVAAATTFIWCLRFMHRHFDRFSAPVDLSPLSNPYISVPLAFFLLSAAAAFLWAGNPKSKSASGLLLAVLLLDLSSFDYFLEWRFFSQPKEIMAAPPAVAQLIDLQRQSAERFRIAAPLADLGGVHSCPPNMSAIWGLSSPAFYSPLVSVRMSRFLQDLGTGRLQLPCRYFDASLDLAAVKFLIVPRSAPIQNGIACDISKPFLPLDQPEGQPAHFVHTGIEDEWNQVYVNNRYLPHFRLLHQARLFDQSEILRIIQTSKSEGSTFDFARTALLQRGDDGVEVLEPSQLMGSAIGSSSRKEQADSLSVLEDRNAVKRLAVRSASRGLLVIANQFFPGWQALVDGKPVKIVRANYAFQAIYLEPGQHLVEMRFEPTAFKAGLSLTILTFLLNLVFAAVMCKKRRPLTAGS